MWSTVIHQKGYCEICKTTTKQLHAHHITGRRNFSTRWLVDNGILLCASCHQFGSKSAHNDPLWFREQLIKLKGEKFIDELIRKSNQIYNKDYEATYNYLNTFIK